MSKNVDRLLKSYADAMATDALPSIVRLLELPMAIYSDDSLIVIKDETDYVQMMVPFRKTLVDLGWVRSVFEVMNQTTASTGNVVIDVNWAHLNDDDKIVSSSSVRLFCSADQDDMLRIQITEVLPSKPSALLAGLSLVPIGNYQGNS